MLAAAQAAKERLRSGFRAGESSRASPPSRKPICSEDEAAHTMLLSQQSGDSASTCYAAGQVPRPVAQQPSSSYINPFRCAGGYGSTLGSSSAAPAVHTPLMSWNDPAGQAAYSAVRDFQALQPRTACTPPTASNGAPYGATDDAETGGGGADEQEDDEPKVPPLLTCGRVCCYMALLLCGTVFGMAANEVGWTDISRLDPALEAIETWLHTPRAGDDGSAFCEDGLFLAGPPRTGANILVYLALLLWTFLGVAIAADVFMAGIEQITSEEKTESIVLPSGEVRRYTITVWNATVANLTLMALGSSAPEILLSCIEIASSGFYAGELGPSTIVGSAAFNMLVISAVCVVAIPAGGGRSIKELPVFYVTAAFSLFAYVWLIVILVVFSPNIVEPWEGVLTFLAFPILVYIAYRADVSNDEARTFDDSPEGAEAAMPIGYDKSGREITKSDVCKVLALKTVERLAGEEQLQAVASMLLPPQSRAYYRKEGLKSALGTSADKEGVDGAALRARILAEESAYGDPRLPPTVEWGQAARTCREAQGKVDLAIVRRGDPSRAFSVQYKTYSGSATEGLDFEAAFGTMHFRAGEMMKTISVRIINDDEEEEDEHFYVRLFGPNGASLGVVTECDVTIQDDDGPGELHFDSREVEAFESAGFVALTVMRTHGCEGTISCVWSTRDGTCKDGVGYEGASGRLVMEEGVTQKVIQVAVTDTGAYHRADEFQVVLSSASGRSGHKPARFVTDAVTRTRRAAIFATVHVHSDSERKRRVDEMVSLLDFSQRTPSVELNEGTWSEQFDEALEMPSDGSSISLVMCVLAMPWKLVGACVPPPSYAGGWACFLVALLFIGVLTAFIGDLASHMGCCMGILPSVTAITFVALGTSLPDTFASKTAAVTEPHADASIVNVTGSNSVNVFLGLGLPWMSAALYWSFFQSGEERAWRERYQGEPWYTPSMPVGFAVPAGDLAYSVEVFVATSCVCLGTLVARRKLIGYELGGPPALAALTGLLFVGLWGVYIYLSVLKTLE